MTAFQGTYWTQVFAIQDENEDPIDLTGYTFEADFRSGVDSSTTLFTLTSGDGLAIEGDADEGRLRMSLTAARTLLCPTGKVLADVHHLNASPGPVHLFRVIIPVKKAVTR